MDKHRCLASVCAGLTSLALPCAVVLGQPPDESLSCTPELVPFGCSVAPEVAQGRKVMGNVSMVALLARPLLFANELIVTEGVLRLEYEGDALYMDADSARHRSLVNAIALRAVKNRLPSDCVTGSRVVAFGRFVAGPCGHFGWASGCIEVEAIRSRRPAP